MLIWTGRLNLESVLLIYMNFTCDFGLPFSCTDLLGVFLAYDDCPTFGVLTIIVAWVRETFLTFV